jgi:nucleoid-associated protein YgaU
MKIIPIAFFTALAVAAAGTLAYVSLKPVTAPDVKVALATPEATPAPAPAPAAPVAEVKKPEEQKVVSAVSNTVQVVVAPEPVAPSFDTVRVETSGETVIAGRAAPDTEVIAKLNGDVIATTKTTADGSFVMIPAKPLPAGAGTLSLETNAAGSTQVSAATVAVAVKPPGVGESTVAVLTPGEPTKIIQVPAAPANTVVLDAVDYDASGNIVFSGRGKPGSVIRLYVDNNIVGEMKADETGKWNYVGTNVVAPGTHNLRADEIAADGSVASRVELPFLREAPATVAAAAEPAPAPVAAVPAVEPSPVAAAAPAAPQPTRIVIQPGNNLWTLSRQIYGAGRNYTVIYEANKDQIRNPRLIYPGQIITAPVAEAKTP